MTKNVVFCNRLKELIAMRKYFFLLLLALPSVASAQFPDEIKPGMRVRVWLPEARRQNPPPERRLLVRGVVESTDGNVLRLGVPGTGGALAIPRASIVRLDVSRGVNRGASMIERAAGGALAGAVT